MFYNGGKNAECEVIFFHLSWWFVGSMVLCEEGDACLLVSSVFWKKLFVFWLS